MSKICEIHKCEMFEKHEDMPVYVDGEILYDKYGVAIMDDYVYYICPICEEEKYMEDKPLENKAYKEYEAKKTEKVEESYLEKYTQFMAGITNAPKQTAKAVLQFEISQALSDAKYRNSKGEIHPNISVFWIAPSGSNKTPTINNGIRRFKNLFPDFTEYSETTGKGLRSDLSKINKNKNKNPVIKHTIVWDEVGTAMKSSKNMGTNDLFEVLSQDYDGLIGAYASIRGGYEEATYPYACMWMSGVPTFWKDADETFWYQGFGLRSLFLKYESPETIEPIFDDKNEIEESEKVFNEMEADLTRIKEVKEIRTTPEFMREYNAYRIANIKAIQEVQKDILTAYEPQNYPIISKGKFPEQWMKLAMIYSASRFNIKDGVLTLELQDLKNAIKDMDEYHENMMENFHVWQNLSEQRAKIENIKPLEEKIEREIKKLIAKGHTYELTRLDHPIKKGENEINYHAKKSKDGKYVVYGELLQYVHMKAKNFKEVAETMHDELKLGWHESSIGEDMVKSVTTFYCLIESKKEDK